MAHRFEARLVDQPHDDLVCLVQTRLNCPEHRAAMAPRGVENARELVTDVPEEWRRTLAFAVTAVAAAFTHVLIDGSSMPFLTVVLWLAGLMMVALAAMASASSTQQVYEHVTAVLGWDLFEPTNSLRLAGRSVTVSQVTAIVGFLGGGLTAWTGLVFGPMLLGHMVCLTLLTQMLALFAPFMLCAAALLIWLGHFMRHLAAFQTPQSPRRYLSYERWNY